MLGNVSIKSRTFSAAHDLLGEEVHRKRGGAQPGQLIQTDQRGIPYHMTHAQYITGWEAARGQVCCLRMAGHLSAGGEQLHCASLDSYILLLFCLPLLSY